MEFLSQLKEIILYLSDSGLDAIYLPLLDNNKFVLGSFLTICILASRLTKSEKDDSFFQGIKDALFRRNKE